MEHVVTAKQELKKILTTLRDVSTVKSRHMSLACTAIEDAVLRLDVCEREAGRKVSPSFDPVDMLDPEVMRDVIRAVGYVIEADCEPS